MGTQLIGSSGSVRCLICRERA